MKDGDFIEHLFVCSTHDYLLFFTNRGKIYRSKVYELPEASRTAEGPRARATSCRCARASACSRCSRRATSPRRKYLVFATRKGMVKKTEFLAYNTPIKADGIIAIKIRDDDELVAVRRTCGEDEILMVSHAGQRGALRGVRRALDGPRHHRRARHERLAEGQRRARDGRRARRPGPARGDRERLRQAHARRRVPQDQARRDGRQDDHADRAARAASRARWWCASTRTCVFISQRRHGAAHLRARHQPLRARLAGRARDEPQRTTMSSARSRWWSRAARTPRRRWSRTRVGDAAASNGAVAPDGGARRLSREKHPCRTSPPFATLAEPEKGGGPNVE